MDKKMLDFMLKEFSLVYRAAYKEGYNHAVRINGGDEAEISDFDDVLLPSIKKISKEIKKKFK